MQASGITLHGEVIRISNWEIADATASALLREKNPEERSTVLARMIKVGALALRDAGEVTRVDYVRAEFTRFLGDLHDFVDREVKQELGRIFDPQAGVFRSTIQEFLGPEGTLARMFDDRRTDSIASRLRGLLEQNLTGEQSIFLRALDPNRPDTPLGQLRTQLAGAVEDAKLAIVEKIAKEEAVEEVSSRTPLKGLHFEDLLLDAIQEIAEVFGDSVEDVRAANKDGDFLVIIDPKYAGRGDLRIALEAKDRSVTFAQTQRELESARKSWNAPAAVMVFAMPEESPQDASFRHTGQGYLCVYDKDLRDSTALQVAYQLARLDALRETQARFDTTRLEEARQWLDRAAGRLRDVATLKSSLTEVTKAISGVYLGLEGLQSEVTQMLSEARRCLLSK